jgi:glycosyltransferase involved in cell wall biosynthesis
MRFSAEQLEKYVKFIIQRKVFDVDFYNSTYHQSFSLDKAIEHYLVSGEKLGYQPNSIFSPTFFKNKYVARVQSLPSLLLDYLYVGAKLGIKPCAGFDLRFIEKNYNIDPTNAMSFYLDSYLIGKPINPNKQFDAIFYLDTYQDVKAAKLDPYYHFINWGANEGRLPKSGFSWTKLVSQVGKFSSNTELFSAYVDLNESVAKGIGDRSTPAKLLNEVKANHRIDQYEVQDLINPKDSKPVIDVFAFYLTQFHQLPENDEWWGTGFTEWTNVVRGLPRFEGHYQPKIPADLGFYDLANKETIRKQVEIAKNSGVTGFGFYYYHFGDKRLLEKPLNLFLEDKSLDLKFFYIWANETWSRRWDGSEKEILIEQKYPEDLIRNIVDDAINAFNDDRYQKIQGRPLFVIYRVSVIPEWESFIEKMREEFKKKNQNPYIYMAQSFTDEDPTKFGLDGALEFPPHKYTRDIKPFTPDNIYTDAPDLKVYKYDDVLDFAKTVKRENFPLIRTCFPSWDNDARRQGNSVVLDGASPEKFKSWLNLIISETKSRPNDPQMICVNAWNEWGEGTYLEPDRRYGYANLNALKSVIVKSPWQGMGKVLLVGHDAFPSGAQRLLLSIGETLKNDFGAEISFLILRADKGYDGILNKYKELAPTFIVDGSHGKDIDTQLLELYSRGYSHAIVNTSVSSKVLPKMHHSWVTIQLVHELASVLEGIGSKEEITSWFKHTNKIISPTKSVKNLLKDNYGVTEKQSLIIPQGLYRNIRSVDEKTNLENWLKKLNLPEKPLVIVGLGYADQRKGIDLFIETCEKLSALHENCIFIWQGDWDPEIKKNLAGLTQKLIEAGKLYLIPVSDDIESLLAFADLFFLSSREDPLPTVAFESWSFGVPVLAFSKTGGIADLIEEHDSLGFVAKEMSSQATSQLIFDLFKNNKLKKNINLKDWVRVNLDWRDYVYRLYKELFMMPEVDVAIIGHNHADFIKPRVESIKEQSYPIKNILYYDVSSNPENLNRIETSLRDDKRLSLIKLPSNEGKLYKTWLEIAESSNAEFIHIAEGDDVIHPDFVRKLLEPLSKHEDAAFAFSAVEWIDADGSVTNKDLADYVTKNFHLSNYHEAIITPEKAFNSNFLVLNPILSMSSALWRRCDFINAIKSVEKELSEISFAFDWFLYFSIFRNGKKALFVNECLTKHRQHNQSMSARKEKHKEEISSCYKVFNSLYKSNDFQNLLQLREKYLLLL